MTKHFLSALAAAAVLAAAGGIGNGAAAQTLPPVPGIMPPIASHADPTLPVPTIPPEQLAPPAQPRAELQARSDLRRLEAKAWARFVPVVERHAPGSGRWAAVE